MGILIERIKTDITQKKFIHNPSVTINPLPFKINQDFSSDISEISEMNEQL